MTHLRLVNTSRRLAAGAVLAALAAGCGGNSADSRPNPDLKIPVSTATEADLKAGRAGGATGKLPAEK